MVRFMCLSILLLATAVSPVRTEIILLIHDRMDDRELIEAVSGQKPVAEFTAEIDAFEKILLANDEKQIEKLFGKPSPRPEKGYAMPAAQHRLYSISGKRYGDEKLNKDHAEFYRIDDFAGVEIQYGINGRSPQYAVLYFKVDEAFPKLKKVEDKLGDNTAAPKKPPVAIRKHTIDLKHWNALKAEMKKEQIVDLFSAPAGDYAPGTDYLTRAWGWRRGGYGKAHETLEWRSEKALIVVAFDSKENFLSSEVYLPGRDPVTNIAERLTWDRERFEKVKKHLKERLAAR